MILKTGDLFNTSALGIGHGVNCQGKMGAGIAVLFRDKYPEMYWQYKQLCRDDLLKPGGCFTYKAENHYVFNMASQEFPGAHATYPYLRRSAFHAATNAMDLGIDRIAIPMIGCGIGGLQWHEVAAELESVEALTGVEFEVWKFE